MSEEHNPTAGHEQRDVPARIPALFIGFMAVFVPLMLLLLWGLMSTVWQELPGPPNPFADEPTKAPAEPSLQASPEADLAELDRRMQQRLQSVGWVDREAERVHMPIDRAMQLLVERGLPEQGAHASETAGPAVPPVEKGMNAATPEGIGLSAARAVAAPDEPAEPGNGQEAGNE